MSSPFRLLIFFLCYIIPPTLIGLRIIPYEYRYETMLVLILGIVVYTIKEKFTLQALGMRWDNFKPAFFWNMAIAMTTVLMVATALFSGYVRNLEPPESPWFYVMYLFLSGPVQEYIYRSAVFAEMDKHDYLVPWQKIMLATLNFAWLHIIYLDTITLMATVFIGLIWSTLYFKYRNYWAISIGHAIVGFCVIWMGLV